jgi:hypothetical protein
MDRRLHEDRVVDRRQRRHTVPWPAVPVGAFVAVDGQASLVQADRLVPWQPRAEGYERPMARPRAGTAEVLTPRSTVAVLQHGYAPVIHGFST